VVQVSAAHADIISLVSVGADTETQSSLWVETEPPSEQTPERLLLGSPRIQRSGGNTPLTSQPGSDLS
jgi:hypothetical protein